MFTPVFAKTGGRPVADSIPFTRSNLPRHFSLGFSIFRAELQNVLTNRLTNCPASFPTF
ncbi:MAG: hypothetical protein ACI82F_002686, partial [Planctomycetota bacterium]